MIKVIKSKSTRLRQGDVIRDVEYIEYVSEVHGIIEVSKIIFPLVVVLTQDCDLEQDFRFRWSREAKTKKTQDKWLLSVLVAPLYNVEHVYLGEHLTDIDIKMEPINRKKTGGTMLANNERPRYHYIEFSPEVPIVPSVVDFKHYFSVNIKYLKKVKSTNLVCSISDIYRADLSQRFASYLARIGLP